MCVDLREDVVEQVRHVQTVYWALIGRNYGEKTKVQKSREAVLRLATFSNEGC